MEASAIQIARDRTTHTPLLAAQLGLVALALPLALACYNNVQGIGKDITRSSEVVLEQVFSGGSRLGPSKRASTLAPGFRARAVREGAMRP